MGRSNIGTFKICFFFGIISQGATGDTLFPLNQWVFVVLTTSTISQKQNGFRYTLPSTSTRKAIFNTRSPTGSFYDLNIGGKIFIGGDDYYTPANAWLQYVRVYLNYIPNSEDEMLNLAIMNTGNIHHALDILLTSLML